MRKSFLFGILLLVSACSTTVPRDDSSSPSNKTVSQANCDAWSKKVDTARLQIGKCSQDSDCVTDHTDGADSCWNQAEFYNHSANYSGFVTYRNNYYASCQVAFQMSCELGPKSISCQQGQCKPNYQN